MHNQDEEMPDAAPNAGIEEYHDGSDSDSGGSDSEPDLEDEIVFENASRTSPCQVGRSHVSLLHLFRGVTVQFLRRKISVGTDLTFIGKVCLSVCALDFGPSQPLHPHMAAFEAAQTGQVATLGAILDANPDFLTTPLVDTNLDDATTSWSLMLVAAFSNQPAVIAELHRRGADLNGVDADGRTALFISARDGQTQAVRMLCELGANVNQGKNDGANPVYIAAQWGYTDIVEILLSYRGQPDLADNEGFLPIHACCTVRWRDESLWEW